MFALFIGRLGLNYINKVSSPRRRRRRLQSVHAHVRLKLCFRMIGIRLSSAIRLHYLERLLGQTIHVLDSMPPGYATTTITTTSNVLQLGVSEKLGVFVEYMSTIVAGIVIVFVYQWSLTLVTASSILFILLTVSLLLPCIVKYQGRTAKVSSNPIWLAEPQPEPREGGIKQALTTLQSESKASSVASEALASIRIIMACGAESRVAAKYAAFVEEAKRHARTTGPFVALQFGLIVRRLVTHLPARGSESASVLCCLCRLWPCFLVWGTVVHARPPGQCFHCRHVGSVRLPMSRGLHLTCLLPVFCSPS